MQEVVTATGHENVSAEHQSTLEVTTDDWLTPAGDCIVGVDADRTPAEFDAEFCAACRDESAEITATLSAGGVEHTLTGRGDPSLSFDSERSLVCRTSDYVDDRTVLVGADGAATDVDRELAAELADGADLTLELVVE